MAPGMERTHLTLVGSPRYQLSPDDRLLLAVRKELGSRFEVYGELGRGDRGKIAYLARDLTTRRLVALLLTPTDGIENSEDFDVHIALKLDASVPTGKSECPRCHAPLKAWAQFCRQCGANLSGILPGESTGSRDLLLEEVKRAARGRYDILGEMENAEGEGIVYFGRTLQTGDLVALRLLRDAGAAGGGDDYNIGVTRVLGRMAAAALADPPVVERQVPTPVHMVDAPVVAPPAIPVVQTPPVLTPERRPFFDVHNQKHVVAGVAVGVVVLFGIALFAARPSSIASQPARQDSVDIQLGGSLPAGAQATLDGAPFSAAVRVPSGAHVLGMTAPGYDPLTQQITLRPGQSMLWMPSLVKQAIKPPVTASPIRPKPRPAATPQAARPVAPPPVVVVTCASLFAKLDWTGALKPCEDEASKGSLTAQRTLGIIYERGLGVDVDYARAIDHYRIASDGNDAFAQYRLGAMYAAGTGVKRDDRQAADWYRRAADQGQMDALVALANALDRGQGVRKDRNESMKLYQRAADLGDARAQYRVGVAYASGDVLPRDEAKALDLLQKSANQGNADAQFKLGEMYAKGQGVAKSDTTARRWYEKAAAQGHQGARKALGM